MNIDNIVNFPFPSPPNPENLIASEKRLALLGALEKVPSKQLVKRANRSLHRKLLMSIQKLSKIFVF